VQEELDRQYQQIAQAVQQKDFAALEGFITPDYTSTDACGTTRNHDQIVDRWKHELNAFEIIVYNCQIEFFERHGDEATVTVRSEATFKIAHSDKQGPPVEWTAVDRQVWRKSCDGWKISATTSLDEQDWQGGELVRPGEAPAAAGGVSASSH
jgi:ketosteroid isomerase-like protein